MSRIPKKLRDLLAEDPFYVRCAISGDLATREDPIQWHHNLIYAGKQVQAQFAIIPIKRSLHNRLPGDKQLKAQLDWVMWNRATDEEVKRYSKAVDYFVYRAALNCMYGAWSPIPLEARVWGIA